MGNVIIHQVRVIARNRLIEFWDTHPDAQAALKHWYEVASDTDWHTTLEVVGNFSKAKALNGERVRFDIAGGAYRLIVAFDFRRGIAFVKFIGTHAQYDRIDALTVRLF